jgi:hypothetical protein
VKSRFIYTVKANRVISWILLSETQRAQGGWSLPTAAKFFMVGKPPASYAADNISIMLQNPGEQEEGAGGGLDI